MYKRALIPLDGSPEAEAIIPFFAEIAGPLDVAVVLLRVLPAGEVEDTPPRRVDAMEYLAPLAAELRGRGVRVHTAVRHGEPASEILAAGVEAGADLIAMTTHGHRFFADLIHGSTITAVRHKSQVPVLLVRAAEL